MNLEDISARQAGKKWNPQRICNLCGKKTLVWVWGAPTLINVTTKSLNKIKMASNKIKKVILTCFVLSLNLTLELEAQKVSSSKGMKI